MGNSIMRRCCTGLLLALLALPAAAESCSAQRGFDLGRAGVVANADCTSSAAFSEAFALGEELATLEHARAEALRQQALASGEAANRHARTARWLAVDIEAIEGALLLRGIVSTGPSAEAARSAASSATVASDDADPRPSTTTSDSEDPQ